MNAPTMLIYINNVDIYLCSCVHVYVVLYAYRYGCTIVPCFVCVYASCPASVSMYSMPSCNKQFSM